MRALVVVFTLFLFLSLTIYAGAVQYEFSGNELSFDEKDLKAYLDSLPEEIRKDLTIIENLDSGKILELYNFDYFKAKISGEIKEALPAVIISFSSLTVFLILICIINNISLTFYDSKLAPAVNMCVGLCFSLVLLSTQEATFSMAEQFLTSVSEIMKISVPVLEGMLIISGRITSSQVVSVGMSVIIAATEAIYQNFLYPAVSSVFILSVVSAVTGNKGARFMVNTVKNLVTTVIIALVTFLTFVFSIQNIAANSADNLLAKTAKFALGSYIPIVGGAVSESFSLLQTSISSVKSVVGIIGIVVVFVFCIAPITVLLLNRLALYLASSLAGMIGCDREGELLNEFGALYTVLIAMVLSAAVMFIIALGTISSANLNGV